MVRSSIVFIAIVLLIGCTSKSEKDLLETYQQDITYHKQLQRTEKIQFYQDDETKVMFIATYLYTPTYEKNDTRDERFIVGLHLHENLEEDINSSEYTLTLNSESPKEIKRLQSDDEALQDLSFITDWADYYLVKFPHVSNKKITLVFESEHYGKGKLHAGNSRHGIRCSKRRCLVVPARVRVPQPVAVLLPNRPGSSPPCPHRGARLSDAAGYPRRNSAALC